ncbi:MAG: hypothetical protein ABEJ72_05675, partial [Candidatus Aenigmatarchaeota archaeon]
MGRGSSRELVQKIASALDSEPKSIQDISDEIGADRKSVEKYLESLKSAGIARESDGGNKRLFLRNRDENKSDTYFNLPLSEKRRQTINSLFSVVSDRYKEITGELPSPIKAQKIAVEAAGTLELDVPRGGYRHGTMTVSSFDSETDYENTQFPGEKEDDVKQAVDEGIKDFAGSDFFQTKHIQYEKEEMDLYLAKDEIAKQLAGKVNKDLEKDLYRFLSHLPSMDSEANDIVVDFVAIAPDLAENRRKRAKLFEVFQTIWDMVS